MRKPLLFVALAVAFACKDKPKENKEETEDEIIEVVEETTSEWTTLFDGTSFDGWHMYNGGEVTEPWTLEDGAMVLYPPEERPEGANYNLVPMKSLPILCLPWIGKLPKAVTVASFGA